MMYERKSEYCNLYSHDVSAKFSCIHSQMSCEPHKLKNLDYDVEILSKPYRFLYVRSYNILLSNDKHKVHEFYISNEIQ